MPHVEVKYSDDLDIDVPRLFEDVERVINAHDASAGICKSRAYPCAQYKYPHLLIDIALLSKPHRGHAFTEALSADIEATVKGLLRQSAYFSMNIQYSLTHYVTNTHIVEGQPLPEMND